MNELLDTEQKAEVDRVMDLALDWLMSWDVVGEGAEIESPQKRMAAMIRLKEAVTELVCKAGPNKE